MVNIKELSHTPGNCFSCGYLNRFKPCGYFECQLYGEIVSDTNNPPKIDCTSWIKRFAQRILRNNSNRFTGIINISPPNGRARNPLEAIPAVWGKPWSSSPQERDNA
jgi:hypothetical protein